MGRFKPENGAHPAIGEVDKLEEVAEERIECVCGNDVLENVIAAIKRVHPYEEPAFETWPVELPR